MSSSRIEETFPVNSPLDYKLKSFIWANQFDKFSFLDNNRYYAYLDHDYECLIAAGSADEISSSYGGAFEKLRKLHQGKSDWLFGFLTYDLKNEIETLASQNPDHLGFPDLHFFQPSYIIKIKADEFQVSSIDRDPGKVMNEIEGTTVPEPGRKRRASLSIKSRVSKEKYLNDINAIREQIIEGDVYELNYCQEFYADEAHIDPIATYLDLNKSAQAPFSCFYKIGDKYLLSASPERFLKKTGARLISQPIKGTIRRDASKPEDELLKEELKNDPKEQAENMMIVDLVRNDLARSSKPGSVKVDELYGIYSFAQVHHMVSTISSELREDCHFIDAIKGAFPMGSMTGAPKVTAMELIEKYESAKRGLYSGSVGYITPNGDFDLNVVIRSILYNETARYLSFQTGGAITFDSIPEKEYEESLLKAQALMEVLK